MQEKKIKSNTGAEFQQVQVLDSTGITALNVGDVATMLEMLRNHQSEVTMQPAIML